MRDPLFPLLPPCDVFYIFEHRQRLASFKLVEVLYIFGNFAELSADVRIILTCVAPKARWPGVGALAA